MRHYRSMSGYPKEDSVAGVVVFLVALPLCLGSAIACGLSPVSGLIAVIVGGLVVPLIGHSASPVIGPAAGLTSIVLVATQQLGRIPPLPSAVIIGVTAASLIFPARNRGAAVITSVSPVVLFGWKYAPKAKWKAVSPALIVVVLASVMAPFLTMPSLVLEVRHFVDVPLVALAVSWSALPRPDFAALALPATWLAGGTIAIVASIETLLSLQAVDRLDPLKRRGPADRELLAQVGQHRLRPPRWLPVAAGGGH